jgi:acyl carrier protein phosphodiesterase
LNFLAHIYLSGDSSEVRMGNIIGDYIKGNQYNLYPELIRMGILMHRDIDHFTDANPIVKLTNRLFTERFHKYAGIVTDIFYDHFLASRWNDYSPDNFDNYLKGVYLLLKDNWDLLPDEMKGFALRCMENNWLKSYATIEGIGKVLWMMSQRTSLPDESKYAVEVLKSNYTFVNGHFMEYFPQLVSYIEEKYKVVIRKTEKNHILPSEVSQAGYHRA